MRELCRASGVALLGPGAILAALLLLVLGGGVGGLRDVGQVFSGPALPAVGPFPSRLPVGEAPSGLGTASAAGQLTTAGPPASGPRSSGALGPRPPLGNLALAPQHPGGGSPQQHGGGAARPGATANHPPAPSRTPPPSSTPAPAPGPGEPLAKPPTLVDRVVGLGTATASKLPGPARAIATQTLRSVGATVDRILDPLPRTGPARILPVLPLP